MTEHYTRDDFVVSFRPHTAYDSPLVAVKGQDAAELADKIGAAEATGLFAIIAGADQAFKAAYLVGRELGGTPVTHPQTAQQQYQQAGGYNGQQPAAGYAAPQQPPQAAGYAAPQQAPQPQQSGGYPQQQGYQGGGYQGGQQQAAPPRGPAATPPGLMAPTCPHGTKNYVEGPYGPFWGCPARRDDPSKCRPEKIRT